MFYTGETFVTRKVSRSVAQIHLGHRESVSSCNMVTHSSCDVFNLASPVHFSSNLAILMPNVTGAMQRTMWRYRMHRWQVPCKNQGLFRWIYWWHCCWEAPYYVPTFR